VVWVIDLGKRDVVGILIDTVDYESAVQKIIVAAHERRPFAASALAVHGIMTGVQNAEHGFRLNRLDLVTPDGQPVRWALQLLHGVRLPDRVYGPKLMDQLCAVAAEEGISVYLYGSRRAVIERLRTSLSERFPDLRIAGAEPSRFRRTTVAEKEAIARRIADSGAGIVFIGLGCPRQEVFAYEYRAMLDVPLVAVGAAFDYHGGVRREPPEFVQRAGLQWLHRLIQEPGRLWKRYTIVSAAFLCLAALQFLKLWRIDPRSLREPKGELLYG
jgi:N-acetylglucosaminyldiphosphoundecaprenol N-acetyl-beta-D-mannosaminyltransferase